jgi:NADH-quinone oxidoreductase subunit M
MALLSAFRPNEALLGDQVGLFRVLMVAGGVGTILTAGYFLWMLQRVNMGTMPARWGEHAFGDIHSVEWLSWTPLLVLILALGLFPRLIFGISEEAVSGIMAVLGAGG